MTAYIVMTCDSLHTHTSKEVIAVCSSMNTAIRMIRQHAKKSGDSISKDDEYLLETIKQTQNFVGDGEYIIDKFIMNQLN